jgi:tetratricopeptide (TPR) repeat protein
VLALLADPVMLQQLVAQPGTNKLQNKTRLSLIKLCIQAELWQAAETMARELLKSEPKPQELYLLLAKTLLEQNKFVELAEVCQAACDHPGVAQPMIFHVELAKSCARLKNAASCQKAISAAKELVAPRTTDEHKILCTELYTQHLLGQHQQCISQSNELLQTSLAQGPWARQVRYLLAHAYEATSQYDQAIAQYDVITRQDPNDAEAMAAQSRCLLFQGTDLARAESVIRNAIELDLIEQKQRQRFSPVLSVKETNAVYQATLGSILLRAGKVNEGIKQLQELTTRKLKPDPWVLLCIGDVYLMQRQNEQARERWQQALELLPHAAMMGTDLTDSLQTRLKRVVSAISPTSASSLSSNGKP